MKKLNEDIYLIEPGLFAERRGQSWYVSDEDSNVLAGPFATLEALEARDAAPAPAPEPESTDLVTLRQASEHLPVSYQSLYAARGKGLLPEPVREVQAAWVKGGIMRLYSLAELKAVYASTTPEQRHAAGMERWKEGRRHG